MSTTRDRLIPAVRIVVVVVAAFLLLAPIRVKYIANFDSGSDSALYLRASCGAPVLSTLGSEPALDGVSPFSIVHPGPGYWGGATNKIELVNARQACRGAAGRRVSLGLSVLLAALFVMWLAARRSDRRSNIPDDRATMGA
jgi:hypothetical protein